MGGIDTVHVVFKTHLDIGFTDLASDVTARYEQEFIPRAIDLARQLETAQGRERFIWTTGSWLIHRYLNKAPEPQRAEMVEAINKGWIRWHGLPFTTHTELMDEHLFRYGLSIGRRLDRKFGKTTIAAKMTDVPGHTISIVPLLQEAGMRYLHIGVNRASKRPAVPSLFRWQAPCGAEIVVNYADDYGQTLEVDGLRDALVFAHTGDNSGPPAIEEIRAAFADISARFPGAEVKASTLDDFAAQLWEVKDRLPVVREEIGDTWIHGAATDPLKLARYRACVRLRNAWLQDGRLQAFSEEDDAFSEPLLLVAEHTWGLDVKKWLPDFRHYAKQDFETARGKDVFSVNEIPDKYRYIGAFAMSETDTRSRQLFLIGDKMRSYSFLEQSWQEQRAYVDQAVQALHPDKRQEILQALEQLVPRPADSLGGMSRRSGERFAAGSFEVSFAADGSIVHLSDAFGKRWVTEAHPFGLYVYEAFGPENYERWFREYMQNLSATHMWADADFGKPGFEYAVPRPRHMEFKPILNELRWLAGREADTVVLELRMPQEAVRDCGAPAGIEMAYAFHRNGGYVDLEMQWFGKEASRLPEASWFSFGLEVDNPNLWMIDKMGRHVSPLHVVKDGNRNLHAAWNGVSYRGADGTAAIESLDAALVCPGSRRLLQFANTFAPLEGGMHFNLHNNIWGTNFPMWYEGDAKFRFKVQFSGKKPVDNAKEGLRIC